jgi:hypothetical protein
MSSLAHAQSHWSPLVLALLGPGSFFSIAFLAQGLALLEGEFLLALWGILWLFSGMLLFREFRWARRTPHLRGEQRGAAPRRRLAVAAAVLVALGFLLLLLALFVHNPVPPCSNSEPCGVGPTALDWTGGLLTAPQLLTISFALDVVGISLMAVALWSLSAGRLPEERNLSPPVAAPETPS